MTPFFNVVLLFILMRYSTNGQNNEEDHPVPLVGQDFDYSIFDKVMGSGEENPFESRIAGGRSVKTGDLPYHLQIRYENKYLCGAALVVAGSGKQVVITAGQCVTQKDNDNYLPSNLFTIVGGRVLRDGRHFYEQVRLVDKIFRREDWFRGKLVHNRDLAVIHINKPFDIDRLIRPIKMAWRQDTPPSGKIVIGGWGFTDKDEIAGATELQITALDFLDIKPCKTRAYDFLVEDAVFLDMFCAGKLESKTWQGACRGDTGSPAAAVFNNTYYLAGLFTYGHPLCGNRFAPSIMMDISYYISWINEMANKS